MSVRKRGWEQRARAAISAEPVSFKRKQYFSSALTFAYLGLSLLSACTAKSEGYFPLGAGLRWEYQYENEINSQTTILKSIIFGLDKQTISDKEYFPHTYLSGETVLYQKKDDGVYITSASAKTSQKLLAYPIELNQEWQMETRIEILTSRHESFSGGESFISQDEEIIFDSRIIDLDATIVVSAGRYTQCLRIDRVATVSLKERTRGLDQIIIEQTEWYARGVGLVKRVRTEKSVPEKYSGKRSQELVAFIQ